MDSMKVSVAERRELTIDELDVVAGGGHFVLEGNTHTNLLDGVKSPLLRLVEAAALAASKAGNPA